MSHNEKKRRGRMASVICRLFGWIMLLGVIAALVPVTVPRFMGYEIYNVVSGSMEPEMPVGSIAYVKVIDPVMLEDGEIAAYATEGSVIMHRVVSNHKVEGYLITKGDANEDEDIKEVQYANVRGRVVKYYPVIGQLMMLLANTLGKVLLLCLALCGVLLNVIAGRMRE